MENANDNVFNSSYSKKLNSLEIESEKKGSKIIRYISRNKFILSVIAAFIFFSWLNILLIYKFYKIVELFY